MRKLLAALPALTALVLGCTSSSSGGGGSSSGGSSSGASGFSCGEYAACSLISSTAVGQAFGTTFSAGMEADGNKIPSAAEAEGVACNFAGTDGWTVSVHIRCCPCADNDEQTDEMAAQYLDETTTSVSGIGDEAFWAAPGADAGLLSNAYTLNVYKGTGLYVYVNVLAPAGTAAPLTGATQVAQTVLTAL